MENEVKKNNVDNTDYYETQENFNVTKILPTTKEHYGTILSESFALLTLIDDKLEVLPEPLVDTQYPAGLLRTIVYADGILTWEVVLFPGTVFNQFTANVTVKNGGLQGSTTSIFGRTGTKQLLRVFTGISVVTISGGVTLTNPVTTPPTQTNVVNIVHRP